MRVPPGDRCALTVMASGWSLSQAAPSLVNFEPGRKLEELALVSELVEEKPRSPVGGGDLTTNSINWSSSGKL
eukprot:138128-Pleurochrysis_carterae.AAC.1